MDQLHIEGIRCQSRIGVSARERTEPQPLLVDLTLWIDLEPAANTDDLSLSVDYESLVGDIQELASDHECRLVETFCGHVCRAVLTDSRISEVRVRISKFPGSLGEDIQRVVVEMRRGAP